MERTLSRTCIIIVLLLFQIFLTSLAFGETPKPTTGVSPCKITPDMVGQPVSVFGRIAFITHDSPEGIFAELEMERCRIGVFIPSRIWDQWDKQQREMLCLGAQLLVSGLLVSFDGRLIVDVSEAPQAYVSDGNASETSESEDPCASPPTAPSASTRPTKHIIGNPFIGNLPCLRSLHQEEPARQPYCAGFSSSRNQAEGRKLSGREAVISNQSSVEHKNT